MSGAGQAAEVVGLALAGGESRRMARDKALLPWADTDLLGHALARLQSVTTRVRLVSGREPRYRDRGFPVDTDTGDGPLAGLLAGLAAAAGASALVLAVDLPLVPVALLARLLERASGADAVVPVSTHGPEPLCAFYAAACLGPIRERVSGGERRMNAFWPDVRVQLLPAAALLDLGDLERLFLNVNTDDDYTRARAWERVP